MSTHSTIARPDGDSWIGSYHHWDGYPSGVGATLWKLYHEHFKGDIETMRRVLVDEHKGWSTINQADFSLSPGFIEHFSELDNCQECNKNKYDHAGADHSFASHPEKNRPLCYCHGERTETLQHLTPDDFAGPYLYIMRDEGLEIQEQEYDENDHYRAKGMKNLGLFLWRDAEPNWVEMQGFE